MELIEGGSMKQAQSEQNEKKRIAIIFGGRSGEHEVSLMSATSVIGAMNREKYEIVCIGITRSGVWKRFCGETAAIEDGSWEQTAEPFNPAMLPTVADFVLPILHGPYGEDGKMQGLLEMLDLPYGGCGVTASAVAMDKALAKDIFLQHGLPVCHSVLTSRDRIEDEPEQICFVIEQQIGYPCFVKPVNMGSSVGISKAVDRKSLLEALRLAIRYDRRVLVEEFINCRELETGVLGNERPEVAAVGEIVPLAEFYDYDAKYVDGGARLQIPAEIPSETEEKIKKIAIEAYRAIDGEGYARVDFFIDRDSGEVYLNEINTIPGFTRYSMFPMLWQQAGLEYSKLLERIVELGYERYYAKDHGETTL